MNFASVETDIPGCYIITHRDFTDERGNFVKTFQKSAFIERSFEVEFLETYYSTSKKNTIRGLHFQTPPHDHNKLVTCLSGEAIDILVDLRKDSLTYGKTVTIHLRSDVPKSVYICKGIAHGFLAMKDETILAYQVSTEFVSDHDHGIHWSSAQLSIAPINPVISKRDQRLPKLNKYDSPF